MTQSNGSSGRFRKFAVVSQGYRRRVEESTALLRHDALHAARDDHVTIFTPLEIAKNFRRLYSL